MSFITVLMNEKNVFVLSLLSFVHFLFVLMLVSKEIRESREVQCRYVVLLIRHDQWSYQYFIRSVSANNHYNTETVVVKVFSIE